MLFHNVGALDVFFESISTQNGGNKMKQGQGYLKSIA